MGGRQSSSPIKVLIVDDSAFMRKTLGQILSEDPTLTVAGQARDGVEALEKLTPDMDIVTMDIDMPRMDGIEAVREIRRRRHPCRVIMVSAHTSEGAEITIRALRAGAEDFVLKPQDLVARPSAPFRQELLRKIKSLGRRLDSEAVWRPEPPSFTALPACRDTISLVAIGSSTGGPSALRTILSDLPPDFPVPIVIAQHMPPLFTSHLAKDLCSAGGPRVVEASADMRLEAGQAVIAPGGHNLRILSRGPAFKCEIGPASEDPGVPTPSVNALFSSLVPRAASVLAVILTGIGDDGAAGLCDLNRAGAVTLAQDQSTCVVFGMPRVAIEKGGVSAVVRLHDMAARIMDLAQASASIRRRAS